MTRGKFQGKETSNNEQPMGAGRFKVKGSRLKKKAAGFGGGIRFGEIRRAADRRYSDDCRAAAALQKARQ